MLVPGVRVLWSDGGTGIKIPPGYFHQLQDRATKLHSYTNTIQSYSAAELDTIAKCTDSVARVGGNGAY